MNIIVFGDSIAWGAFDYEGGGWVDRLKKEVYPNHFVYNRAISGFTSSDLLAMMHETCKTLRDDDCIIIIAIGLNDCSSINHKQRVPYNKFLSNLKQLIKIARKETSDIFLVGLTGIDDECAKPVSWDRKLWYDNDASATYNYGIKLIANEGGVEYVDIRNGIGGFMISDGVHLNSRAHEIIKENVLVKIHRLLNN